MSNKIMMLIAVYLLLPFYNAYAYLDPATLTMVFQAVVAGFVTGIFFVKKNWYAIKNKFSNKKTDEIKD